MLIIAFQHYITIFELLDFRELVFIRRGILYNHRL